MKSFGIPAKLTSLTKITLSKHTINLKSRINCQKVLEQNAVSDTLLFNIGLEEEMRNMAINPRDTIFNRTRQLIAYADDVAIIGRSVGALNEVFTQLQTAAVSTGLVINTDKTKYMET
jgi:hypothetical protein